MFDPKDIETYRSLRAPASLQQRVLESTAKPKRKPIQWLPAAAAIAACLMIAVIAVPFLKFDAPAVTVSVSGEWRSSPQVASLDTPYAAERSAPPILTLESEGEITIEAADNTLFLLIDGSCEPLNVPYTADQTITLQWNAESPTARLTANGYTYELCADEETGEIRVQTIVQD